MSFREVLASLTLVVVACANGETQAAVSDPLLEIIPANEIADALEKAPFRVGPPPDTRDGISHQQHNQNAPVAMQEALKEAASALPGIKFEPTPFSFFGSVGWRLEESFARGPSGAFISQSLEFGHQHVPTDGSMHMLLPLKNAAAALEKGWGVIHPLTDSISGEHSDYVMIFGPRDEADLKAIWIIAQISYYQARGFTIEPTS